MIKTRVSSRDPFLFPIAKHLLKLRKNAINKRDNESSHRLQERINIGRPYDIPTKEIFRELNWQSLPDRWEKNKLMFMHKVKSNELPASMNNLFQIANNTNYDLRSNGNDFLLQKPKTNYMKKSITYNGAIAWNKLPNNVKAANICQLANSRLFSTANNV